MPQAAAQLTLDELGTPLFEVTFVVVDLETTGGSPSSSAITEIGAVKTRAGEVIGEFQTLVNPVRSIPAFIAVLTGITDAMVASAPTIASAMPAFLEWVGRDVVLVAHNSPFDVGFLRAACAELDLAWPKYPTLDTARLARAVVTRDEAPDCRLGSLARLFRSSVTPCHRALADAQATVDVLHGLIGRVGSLGVHTWEELRAFSALVTPEQRRKRRLADGLPHRPGVYLFRAADGRPLYVGKSRDLATRVRSYFTSGQQRRRMAELVRVTERVDHVVCAHALEAEVRELRLIAELRPPYNRRSKFPERACYLVLTGGCYPRLSIVRRPPAPGTAWLGPFGSTRSAESARDLVHDAFPLRRCTQRLSPRRPARRCALGELGRCVAPCDGGIDSAGYAAIAGAVRDALVRDPAPVVTTAALRMAKLAAAERFEEAADLRDRLAAFVAVCRRRARLAGLVGCELLAAAAPSQDGGWELVVMKKGRLVGAATVPRGAAPRPYLDALMTSAESLPAASTGFPPGAAALAEEVEAGLRWLEQPGCRLVDVDGTWCVPWVGPTAVAHRARDPTS